MGKANSIAPRLRPMVPTIQGRIPPLVMESMGGRVKNVQLIALHPLEIMKYNIITSAIPLIQAAVRKMLNTIFCMVLRLLMVEGADFEISLLD
jgi:hypothetical protein